MTFEMVYLREGFKNNNNKKLDCTRGLIAGAFSANILYHVIYTQIPESQQFGQYFSVIRPKSAAKSGGGVGFRLKIMVRSEGMTRARCMHIPRCQL